MTRKLFDLHTHTKYSDGRSPVVDNVRVAEAGGLSVVAITDHLFDSRKIDWVDNMLSEVRNISSKVRVLAGVEGVILNPAGEISVDEDTARKLDLVLVDLSTRTEGIGSNPPTNRKELIQNTANAYINVCQNDVVDIVAHPFNLGRFAYEVYLDEIPRGSLEKVAGAFVKGNKVFEIMNLMAWWFPDVPIEKFTKDYVNLVKIFAREGVRFSLGSDAHSDCGVGNLTWSRRVVKEARIENQLIDPGFFDNKRRL